MLKYFFGPATTFNKQKSAAGAGLLFNGLLCVLFGIAIFANPNLLAFLIATLLIIIGASMLSTWWSMRNLR